MYGSPQYFRIRNLLGVCVCVCVCVWFMCVHMCNNCLSFCMVGILNQITYWCFAVCLIFSQSQVLGNQFVRGAALSNQTFLL